MPCIAEPIRQELEDKLKQLPKTSELIFTEAALPLCYQHCDGIWDICDYVI